MKPSFFSCLDRQDACIKFSILALTVFSLIFPLYPRHVQAAGKDMRKAPPIHIKSDTMEAADKDGTVIFRGNVVAIRGDLTINSDSLKIIYKNSDEKDADGKKKRTLSRIIATGHVKIVQGKKVGTGKEAVYDKGSEKLVLIGDAQVWEGENRIKGTRITLYLNENRSVVESTGNQKVEATVYAD